jgi:hypothetical protein
MKQLSAFNLLLITLISVLLIQNSNGISCPTPGAATCPDCGTGYIAHPNNGSICTRAIYNCMKWSTDYEVCLQCKDTFYMKEDKSACLNGTIINCMVYFSQKNCSLCAKNFKLNLDKTKCVDMIPGCGTYNNSDPNVPTCSSCAVGYTHNVQRTICTGKIGNCSVFTSDTACQQCFEFFEPTSDFGFCTPGRFDNCTLYSSKSQCSACQLGFKVKVDKQGC